MNHTIKSQIVRLRACLAAIVMAMSTNISLADEPSLQQLKDLEIYKCKEEGGLTLPEQLGLKKNSVLEDCIKEQNVYFQAFKALDANYYAQTSTDASFRQRSFTGVDSGKYSSAGLSVPTTNIEAFKNLGITKKRGSLINTAKDFTTIQNN